MTPFDPLALAVTLMLGQADPSRLAPVLTRPVTFDPRSRAVSDWRGQAAQHLDASPGTRLAILLGRDPAAVSRCVRLNNYWCIKRGGWSGEIAADRDGHVAFASAAEGAAVAALLLRRYYVDDGRHSAFAIVSHWAPTSCGSPMAARASRVAAVPHGLAVRGIGRTLRARWLAARGHRVGGGRGLRRSVVPDRLIGLPVPAPAIALGLGAAPVALSASLPDGLALSAPTLSPVPTCTDDAARIRNYAAKAVAGLAPTTEADLKLFDAAGRPTPNLERLMHNMSAVEIGPLGADAALIATAVVRATEAVAARTAAARRASNPGTAGEARLDEARRPEP